IERQANGKEGPWQVIAEPKWLVRAKRPALRRSEVRSRRGPLTGRPARHRRAENRRKEHEVQEHQAAAEHEPDQMNDPGNPPADSPCIGLTYSLGIHASFAHFLEVGIAQDPGYRPKNEAGDDEGKDSQDHDELAAVLLLVTAPPAPARPPVVVIVIVVFIM